MTSFGGTARDGWRTVREEPAEGLPALVHPAWREAYPWLVQGTTHRGDRPGTPAAGVGRVPFDLGLFSDASPPAAVMASWAELTRATDMTRAVVAHQVHGAAVRLALAGAPGLLVTEPCDGHVTREPGTLLAVTAADCVPVTVVEPALRAVAMLHAGWRGVAAGILEAGLDVLGERLAARPGRLRVHLGPAICGSCYQVGPEVAEALGQPAATDARLTVDLRAVLAARAEGWGVPAAHISISEHCTLCGEGSSFFTHRGGDRERHVGYVGVRA